MGVALLALFAFSLVAASLASALTFLLAEWLDNGTTISTPLLVDHEGEITLINLDGGNIGVKVEILCSLILDGTVSSATNPSEDSITSLLNLEGEEISGVPLEGLELECVDSANCTEPLVWAEELPWKTELELMEDGTEVFFADFLLKGAFEAECLIAGISVEELCTTPELAIQLTNQPGGPIDEEFSDAFQALTGLKLGSCGGKPEEFEIAGLLELLFTNGDPVTASSGA